MRKKGLWRAACWLFVIAALVCFCLAGWVLLQRRAAEQTYEAVREEAALPSASEPTPSPTAGPTLEEILNAPFEGIIDREETKIPPEVFSGVEEAPIDFLWLEDVNPELYAWIRVPDTQIDYPVAQHEGEDQEYYLAHDLYGSPQFAGCIFSQAPNALDFSDPVTVLYGHNMKNGSMFQNLYFFLQDPDFFDTHPYIYIYTKDRTYVYEVISAYYSDNINILQENDFSEEEVFAAYREDCLHPRTVERYVREGAELDADSRILTLSTCRAGVPAQRYLVQAVLAYEKDVT